MSLMLTFAGLKSSVCLVFLLLLPSPVPMRPRPPRQQLCQQRHHHDRIHDYFEQLGASLPRGRRTQVPEELPETHCERGGGGERARYSEIDLHRESETHRAREGEIETDTYTYRERERATQIRREILTCCHWWCRPPSSPSAGACPRRNLSLCCRTNPVLK